MTFRWCSAIARDFQKYTRNERERWDDDVKRDRDPEPLRRVLLDEKRPKGSIEFRVFGSTQSHAHVLVLMTGEDPRAPK